MRGGGVGCHAVVEVNQKKNIIQGMTYEMGLHLVKDTVLSMF